ncbi:hypothetical protein Godav_013778, partial [Gossypium davidsonii]|nr:hypothetical protein [Gossypium davidsonii]
MSMVDNSSSDESDDEREKKEILQRMECFNRLFVVASFFVQLYYEKYILKQPCMDLKQSSEAWIREIFDGHKSRCMINFRMSKIAPVQKFPDVKKDFKGLEQQEVDTLQLCLRKIGDTRIFLDAIRDPKYKFPQPPNGNYYLVDFGYPQMKGYLGPYRSQQYHLPDFRRGRPIYDFMEYENINVAYENIINPEYVHDGESDDVDDGGGG